MGQSVEVVVGLSTPRGRFRVEGRRLVLEWRGGRAIEWCGILKPEIVATSRLKQLVSRTPLAA